MDPVLVIQENEKVILPKKYHKINNLCAIIYDQLTEIFKDANYKELHTCSLEFPVNTKFVKELDFKEMGLFQWLKNNELTEEIEMVISKQITLAVVSDFVNFMFESMYNAKRGKMTVAYALLRKPLTDELLILEQLLGNRTDFINRFFHIGLPENYDPSNRNIDKNAIIESALAKMRLKIFPSTEFIYDLRYSKECEYGINGISNQAIHIVTKDKSYKTSEQNLNFVFSQLNDIENYWRHYYILVPYLLIYAVSIIDELIFSILTDADNQNVKVVKELRRLIALVLSSEFNNTTKMEISEDIFKIFEQNLTLECPECNHKNNIERADCELFFETELFICSSCMANLLTTAEAVKKIEKALFGN